MNIGLTALTISCVFTFGFIPVSNGCCCTVFPAPCFLQLYNCNIFGCNCAYEKCTEGWTEHAIPSHCDPDEKCSAKRFRNGFEVNQWPLSEPNERFLLVDLNKDGSITFDEFNFLFGM